MGMDEKPLSDRIKEIKTEACDYLRGGCLQLFLQRIKDPEEAYQEMLRHRCDRYPLNKL